MNHFKTSVAAAIILGLGACSPVYNEQNPNQRTQTGAIIGGLVGGLVGASASDNKLAKGIAGAGIGAAVGGVIGQQLDRQAADLRTSIPNEDVQIVNTGSELRVTMPQELLFAVDSAELSGARTSELRALAFNLNEYPNSDVIVTGHTDNTGSEAYNYDLSQRRASSVSNVLVSAGVDPSRVRSFGQGETNPIATNDTEFGRSQNRRVDITIRPRA